MMMVAQRSFYKHMDDKNASVIKQIIIRVLLGGPIKNTRRPTKSRATKCAEGEGPPQVACD